MHCNDLDTLRAGFAGGSRAPVIYDAHELSTEGGVLRRWERWLADRRERRLAPRAAAVVTVNRPIAEWLLVHRRLRELPAVVMNGAVECLPAQAPRTPLRLLFQGQLFHDRDVDAVVRVMPRLRGRAVLTIQGWGEAEPGLRHLVHELGLTDVVRFVAPCDPADVVRDASEHDVGLIVHKPINLNHRYSAPNKLFDYLGAGLALVVPDLPVMKSIVQDSRCGLVFEYESAPTLGDVLERLVSNPGLVNELKQASARACQVYGWSQQAKELLSVYERVASGLPGALDE